MSVLVIGGGISGLAASYYLAGAGLAPTLLEPSSPGGQVRGISLAGRQVDIGAEAFAAGSAASALATELGLELESPAATGSRVWSHATSRPLQVPPLALLGIPGDLAAPELAAALSAHGLRAAWRDRSRPLGPIPEMLEPLVRERMGDEVAERLVAPVVGGIYSMPLAEARLDRLAPGLRAALAQEGSLERAVARLKGGTLGAPRPAVERVKGGMHLLAAELVRALQERGGTIRQEEALGLERTRGGWECHTATRSLAAGRVLLALPAPAAHRLLGSKTPAPAGTPIALVALAVRADLADAPLGTGILVGPGSPIGAKALTHISHKWHLPTSDGVHLLRVSYGRAGEPALADVDQALADAAILLARPLGRDKLVEAATATWQMAPPRPPAALLAEIGASGLDTAGFPVGLAAAVAGAREVAVKIRSEL